MLLGHGAGGGFTAPDLLAVTDVATRAGVEVVHVVQPYRVAGRRAPAPARQLDAAWLAVARTLHEPGVALLCGGRSSGARVACRTSEETGAAAVLCLAFPEHPPGKPERSRQAELDAVRCPVLVVQGRRDRFGCPEVSALAAAELVLVEGDHALAADPPAVAEAVGAWLERVFAVL